MKHFLDFTATASVREQLHALNENALVVYSPTSLKSLGNVCSGKCTFVSAHDIGKDATRIEKMCTTLQVDKVVALGGGTAIDIAKYIANLTHATFICMPTMLSTNAFATNKVALMRNGTKVTLDAKLPDEIILDPALVLEAEAYNLYGLCDILSIHTALYDWVLADKAGMEKLNMDVYGKASKLLNDAVHLTVQLTKPTSKSISTLFTLIGESGHITNLYTSGRPESGSEHIFAKELERRLPVPHGISIAAGITLMSRLQNNYSVEIQNALKQTGVMNAVIEGLGLRSEIQLSLNALKPRKDRYTILDEKLPDSTESSRLTGMLYATISRSNA